MLIILISISSFPLFVAELKGGKQTNLKLAGKKLIYEEISYNVRLYKHALLVL